jgi:alginate O-acetyltransferase complex protein AlgI
MRNYLYIPLGGNRRSTARTYVNLVAVFLLSGLWHGASWNFVVWGAFHGAFLVADRLFLERGLERLPRPVAAGFTFGVVMLGWVVFRLEEGSADFYGALAGFGGGAHPVLPAGFWALTALAGAFSFAGLTRLGRRWEERVFEGRRSAGGHVVWTAATLVLLFASFTTLVSAELNPFIYFRF